MIHGLTKLQSVEIDRHFFPIIVYVLDHVNYIYSANLPAQFAKTKPRGAETPAHLGSGSHLWRDGGEVPSPTGR